MNGKVGAAAASAGTDAAERSVLLLWMIFTGLSVFAAFLLWRYGLIRLMVSSDRTYISSVIAVLYIVTCIHCFWRTRAIAREGEVARGCRAILAAPDGAKALVSGALASDARRLPGGLVTDHIRSLVQKADAQAKGRIDQTLLLRTLADRLRGSNGFGAFVSDTLMKLGLLGTIIGFIIMLAPIASLDAADKVAMKSSMGLMSDGMAVAMYTTLAGLIGSILVRIQYYMLDSATQRVFSDAVVLTETHVTPALERRLGTPLGTPP
ncbi:MotA/TolQ/ExbB proton channel family protein [Bradyrhizobium sp. Pear77]|uniref:MotA/TolQ/ExbB proton channel family protein n=1 Tax=Bradyrhizobium altum TaxID=1571202 RepID=UPI001E41EAB2|nr:MotA/TolQ/ExbB proton channel family protein [Bradyrhizobium altum]MCC8959452.1 MotA/TolQ/ExbB proton channel family protein [Bradyrhizobium altum]